MRILITGTTGFLGSRIRRVLETGEGHHDISGSDTKSCDIGDFQAVKMLFDRTRPELVIHCAAIGDIGICETNPSAAMRVNVAGTRHIASCCADYGAKLISISSDQVYDYYSMQPLNEYSTPAPANFYGVTKLRGEAVVRALVPRHYILRLGWQYGIKEPGLPPSRDGIVEQLERCLKEEMPVYYTENVRQNITYIYDTAMAVRAMAEGKIPYGTYNVASENGLTERETKALILRRLGADGDFIRRMLIIKPGSRPFDLRAEPLNLRLAGYDFPTFEDGLERCLRKDENR